MLKLCECCKNYRYKPRLLASFETILPLREPSHLLTPPLYDLILRDSEGTIGEMATLLIRATATALSRATIMRVTGEVSVSK